MFSRPLARRNASQYRVFHKLILTFGLRIWRLIGRAMGEGYTTVPFKPKFAAGISPPPMRRMFYSSQSPPKISIHTKVQSGKVGDGRSLVMLLLNQNMMRKARGGRNLPLIRVNQTIPGKVGGRLSSNVIIDTSCRLAMNCTEVTFEAHDFSNKNIHPILDKTDLGYPQKRDSCTFYGTQIEILN
jgi:hypothetical protein